MDYTFFPQPSSSTSLPPVALLTSLKTTTTTTSSSSSTPCLVAQCGMHSEEFDCVLFLTSSPSSSSSPDIKSLSLVRTRDILSSISTEEGVWDNLNTISLLSNHNNTKDESDNDTTCTLLNTVSQIGQGLEERLMDAATAAASSTLQSQSVVVGWLEEFLTISEAIFTEFLAAIKQFRVRQTQKQLLLQQKKRKRGNESYLSSSIPNVGTSTPPATTTTTKFYTSLLTQLSILESYKKNQTEIKITTNNSQDYTFQVTGIDVNETLTNVKIQCTDESQRIHELCAVLNPNTFPNARPEFVVDLPVNDFSPPWTTTTISTKVPGLASVILNSYIPLLSTFQTLWNDLSELDTQAWILEPELPAAKSSTKRRIAIQSGLSLVVTLDPYDCRNVPLEMRLVGMGENVEELRGRYATFVSEEEDDEEEKEEEEQKRWSKHASIKTNIESWLGFTLPSPTDTTTDKSDYVVECGICYAHRLPLESSSSSSSTEDCKGNGPIPDVTCSNSSCKRVYHESCLFEWLHSLPSARISFDRIFGTCPYCMEGLSVRVNVGGGGGGM